MRYVTCVTLHVTCGWRADVLTRTIAGPAPNHPQLLRTLEKMCTSLAQITGHTLCIKSGPKFLVKFGVNP